MSIVSAAVAPAWSNGEGDVNAFFFEFVRTSRAFAYTTDSGVSDNYLYRLAV